MRVLITGAFGYLGGRLADGMQRHELLLGARTTPDWAARRFSGREIRRLDLLEAESLAPAVAGADAVVHLASLDEHEAARDPDLAVRVSGEGTRRLLAACQGAGVRRFVYLSTFHVYGPTSASPIDEGLPVHPVHPYAISRLVGEGYCYASNRAHGADLRTVVLRMSNGFGAPIDRAVDRFSLAHNDFCQQAVTTGTIVLRSAGLQHRDMVWVEDVARALDIVLTTPELPHDLLQLGGGRSISMLALAELVRDRATGLLGREVRIERPDPKPGERERPVAYSIERLRALGYTPRDGLRGETDRLLRLLTETST